MAEPLTSTDIIRERMGFGVSALAPQETRQAYAAAGLSPLGTQERERIQRGAGISPMASQQERDAWKMTEFMAGRREQAPISYGGIGDRPIGTSRRDIRMQAEWDKQMQQQLEQQFKSQQMADTQRRIQLDELEYQRGIENDMISREDKLQKELDDAEVRQQGLAIYEGIKAIDFKNDPDAILKMDKLANEYPRGLEMTGLADTLTRKQNIATTYGASRSNKEIQAMEDITRTAYNDFLAAGGDPNGEAMIRATRIDPITGNKFVDPFELQRQTAMIKGAGAKAEKAAKSPEAKRAYSEEEEARSERGKIRSSIRDIEDKIAAEEAVQASGISGTKLKESQAAMTRLQTQLQRRQAELEQYGGGVVPPATVPQPQTTGQRPALGDIFGGR